MSTAEDDLPPDEKRALLTALNTGSDEPRDRATLHLETLRSKLLCSDALDKLPPPELLIDGLLVRNTLAAIYGKPGAGKSFLAMDWALSVATGSWWFAHEVAHGPVLYLAAEGSAGLAQRKQAWEQARNISASQHPIVWLPMAVNLLDAQWSEALIRLVVELDPILVIIDTLARSMVGGDENAARDMSVVVDNADRVRIATSATVLVVHHTPKDGETLRGHSSLEGAVDTAIEVRSDGEIVAIKVTKQKDMAKCEKITLRLEATADSAVLHSHGAVGVDDELAKSEATLLEVVMGAAGSDGLSAGALLKISELPPSSFYRALKGLATRGLIVNVGTEKQPRWADENHNKKEHSQ